MKNWLVLIATFVVLLYLSGSQRGLSGLWSWLSVLVFLVILVNLVVTVSRRLRPRVRNM